MVSAPTARVPVPFMAPIGASKAALVSLSDALRTELAAWKIPVVVVEPGGSSTEIFAKADAAAQAALASTDPRQVALYSRHLDAVAKAAGKQTLGAPEVTAELILKSVQARSPKRRYSGGSGSRLFATLSHLPAGIRDRAVSSAFGLSTLEESALTGLTLLIVGGTSGRRQSERPTARTRGSERRFGQPKRADIS